MVMKAKILILLPTLNEVHHIFSLYKKILSQKLNTDFLFIDDGSTDGTWDIIKKIKRKFLLLEKIKEKAWVRLTKMVYGGLIKKNIFT